MSLYYYVSKLYKFWDDSDNVDKKERLYINGSIDSIRNGILNISNKRPLIPYDRIDENTVLCIRSFPTNNVHKLLTKMKSHFGTLSINSENCYKITFSYLYRIIKFMENNYDDGIYKCMLNSIINDNM